ncbi:triadin-like [Ptychodera flava]|uniref:triadin-like n=1 Tax=Ptychodera flava TaxID=63121 RepID=UPI00396A1607
MEKKSKTPVSSKKMKKSGLVTPKMDTPNENKGKDTGKRSGKKRKPASEDQSVESPVEMLSSQMPENGQAESTPRVKTDTPKKTIKTPKSEKKMFTPKIATPVEKTGKDTGKRSGKKRKPASEDQLEESAVEVLVSEMPENNQAESTPKVKTDTPKKMIKTPKSGKEMVTPKIATPVEKTGKDTGKKSAKKKKPSSEDQSEESAVEVLVSQMPENDQAESTPKVKTDTPKKTIKTPKSGKEMVTPKIATPIEKTGKDTGKKSAKKKKPSSEDQSEESAVEVLVSQMPENDQAESTPKVKTDTPKKTIKTPKSGKEMVMPKIATPIEKTGKDTGKRSAKKKKKTASEDQSEESAVELLVSQMRKTTRESRLPR